MYLKMVLLLIFLRQGRVREDNVERVEKILLCCHHCGQFFNILEKEHSSN
jgi:hypothetical protein